jgi:ribosomal subunit interface protein
MRRQDRGTSSIKGAILMSPMNIEVTTRGDVSENARAQARTKIGAMERFVKRPILGARVVLTQERNPRIPECARAEAEIDIQGRLVRARATGPSMDAAVDEVAERLQRQLRRHVDRRVTKHRRPATATAGEWFHRSWSPPRPPTFERPAADREIIRRKSFASGPMSPAEAAEDLDALDHDFFLFHDAETDTDAVLYRRGDGHLGLIASPDAISPAKNGTVRKTSRVPAPIALQAAVTEMNAGGHEFLFFENSATRRGNVIYRRYDGHYGLIEPA